MRTLLFVGLACAVVAFDAAAQTALVGQRGIARPGGVYTSLTASDPAACAWLCAQDGICMAWTYLEENAACELKAVVPGPVAQSGAISGLSQRAPDFTRELNESLRPATEVADIAPPIETLAPYTPGNVAPDIPELLGGPLEGAATAPALPLRARLLEEAALRR